MNCENRTGVGRTTFRRWCCNPADHYKGKTITAKGTVQEVDGVPRIEIDESNQIAVVKKKSVRTPCLQIW